GEGTWTYRVKATDGTADSAFATDPSPIVVVDLTNPAAPTASAGRAPDDSGGGGWYEETVTVTYTDNGDPVNADDGSTGSGVASVSSPDTFATSGNRVGSGTVTDKAGNTSTAGTLSVN